MTTRSDQDLNASTSIHVGRTTTGKISGSGEGLETDELNAAEQSAQLADLKARHGQTIARYPISPSQDQTGATKK